MLLKAFKHTQLVCVCFLRLLWQRPLEAPDHSMHGGPKGAKVGQRPLAVAEEGHTLRGL